MIPSRFLRPFAFLATAASGCAMTITEGHIDLNIGFDIEDRTWALYSQYRAPDDAFAEDTPVNQVVFRASETARFAGLGGFYPWLGAAGSDVWVLPQNQAPGVPWLGFGGYGHNGTEGGVSNDFSLFDPILSVHPTLPAVQVSFVGVIGPVGADFAVWQTGGTGQLVGGVPLFSNAAGSGAPNSIVITSGQHSHYNWGFSQEGIYTVLLQLSASIDGESTTSDPFEVTFHVGNVIPEPSAYAAILSLFAALTAVAGRRCART